MAVESLNIAGVAADLLLNARDNKDHIFTEVYDLGEDESDIENGIAAMSDYTTMMDTPDEVVLTTITGNGALRPGGLRTAATVVFAPKVDAIKMKTRVAKVEHISMDFEFTQKKLIMLKKSYFSDVRSKKLKADEIPFEEYVLQVIMAEAKGELRLAYFQGIKNTGTGTGYLDIFDGYRKQILDAISTLAIPAANVIDTAIITAANAVTEFEKIVAGIPTKMLGKVVCLTSRAGKENYEKHYRATWGTLPYNDSQKKPKIVGTSIPFLVEPGLDGFARPIFTTRNNFVRLVDSTDANSELEVFYDKKERSIALMFDGAAGCGIIKPEEIWTNDGV